MSDTKVENELSLLLSILERRIHYTAVEHGFWSDKPNPLEKLMLVVTEIAEAVEVLRDPEAGMSQTYAMSSHISPFNMLDEEIADAIIRLLDFSTVFCENLPAALLAKLEYNEGRPYRHGNKNY